MMKPKCQEHNVALIIYISNVKPIFGSIRWCTEMQVLTVFKPIQYTCRACCPVPLQSAGGTPGKVTLVCQLLLVLCSDVAGWPFLVEAWSVVLPETTCSDSKSICLGYKYMHNSVNDHINPFWWQKQRGSLKHWDTNPTFTSFYSCHESFKSYAAAEVISAAAEMFFHFLVTQCSSQNLNNGNYFKSQSTWPTGITFNAQGENILFTTLPDKIWGPDSLRHNR